jgi:hypothetical protein
MARALAEIRSDHVSNTCHESYRYANPLDIITVIIIASSTGSPCLLDAAPDKDTRESRDLRTVSVKSERQWQGLAGEPWACG